MKTDRLEAFSDGVIAIIITIMVLEIKVPQSHDLAALRPLLPVLLSYVLSFIYVGIYWNNHHHLFQVAEKVTGRVLWANLHLLFWLSLIPFATSWVGESHFAEWPVALYGIPLLMAAIAYYILAQQLIRVQGCDSQLARAIGKDVKGQLSVVIYLAAIALSFLNPWIGFGLYVAVAILWFIPDRRIETQDREDATHDDIRQTEPTAAAATGDGADGGALDSPAVGLGADGTGAATLPDNLLLTLRRGHPRLLASSTTWETIQKRRRDDAQLDAFLKRGEIEARAILSDPPIPYKKDGKRLLHVSRVVLRRVLLLGLHARLLGDAALAKRAQEEMLNAAAFADWNPSHFLDVGEMTAALAFGFDWLYDQLDVSARTAIVAAIVDKGLRAGLSHDGGASAENNWNAVCLGGLALGALAVADEESTLAAQMLDKVKKNNPRGLKVYAPAGVYPEGPMYWGYGTTFEVILLAALQSAIGTDWGLSQNPGFLQSGDATRQLLGPTGLFFDFSDGVERPGTEPAMWWYAHTLKQPDLLRYDMARLKDYAAATKPQQPTTEDNRLLPLAALWWPEAKEPKTAARRPLHWYGPGPNPLAVFRSAWDDPQAMFLALKGGSASLSHAHMDAGSFVFDANGVRWGHDLGMQDYLSLESKGVDLWNMAQASQRWDVFRLGPFSHSTLTVNGQRHHAVGHAAITHFSDAKDAGVIVDLTPVFAEQAAKVTRGFVVRPGSHVLIRDEMEGLTPGALVRWALMTKADVMLGADVTQATLREAGQTLGASMHSSEPAKWETISAEAPVHSYDAPNPGARLLIANLTVPASGKMSVTVTLQPGINKPAEDALAQTELRQWPFPAT